MRRHVVDAGPLVAFLSARDGHHAWARHTFATLSVPLLSCEAVIVEAWYLLRASRAGQDALLELLDQGLIELDFQVKDELKAIKQLTKRYKNIPMSLADACLVRLAELFDDAVIVTVNRDFAVYRKHGRSAIPLIAPFS